MKMHIVDKGEETIAGYSRVEVKDEDVDLGEFSDNECSFILASDCLDLFSHEKVPNLLFKARQKLRMGGKLMVGGTDIRLLARAIINGSIDTQSANNILFNKRSCSEVNDVVKTLEDIGLNVLSMRISGIHYEIEASR